MRTVHKVKSWKYLFRPAVEGMKLHDFRDLDERRYRTGDILLLQEYDPSNGTYTGRQCPFEITYITSNLTPCAVSSAVLKKGYGVLSIKKVGDVEEVRPDVQAEA